MASEVTTSGGSAPLAHAMGKERKKLKKVLSRFDLICFTISAFIALDTYAVTAAYGGGQVVVWIVFGLILYLVPSGLISAELGAAFPVEGGPYSWTRMAFGRYAGALTATFYWMANPTWMGGTLAAVTVGTLSSGLMFHTTIGTFWSIVIGVIVVWAIVGLSIIEVKWGRWTGIIGTAVRIVTLALFMILVAWFLIKNGKPAGAVTWSDMAPTLTGFLTVIGLIQFLFVGFELASNASEEMHNPKRDVPAMILRSGIYSTLIALAFIFGILLILPGDKLANATGFPDAYAAVSGVLGGAQGVIGWILGILIILTLLSSGGVWLQGAARTQAVAGLDGAAPLWLGKFSKAGTPLAMNIVSAIVGSAFVIMVFTMASGSLASFFGVMLSIVVSLTALQYLLIMPSVIMLRKKYPDRPRPYRIPGGAVVMWLCVIATEFIIILTAIALLWPGALEWSLGRSYDMQTNWGTSRAFFEEVTLGTLALVIIMATVFWWVGKRNLAKGVVGESDLLAVATPAPATGVALGIEPAPGTEPGPSAVVE